MSDEKSKIKIECPHCAEENTINLSSEIKCKHCDESLIGEKYRKPLISAFTAILLGIGGGVALDEYLETDRYPISVEYKIMDNCISSYDKPLAKNIYGKKTDICLCALYKTEKKYNYSEYRENEYKFLNIFEEKAKECMQ